MKKIIVILIAVIGNLLAGGIPTLTVPIRIDSALVPKVRYIDQNNDSIKSWSRIVTDTLNRRSDTVAYYLDNSGGITGTGQLVRSASPTLTGTANVANMVFSGTLTANALTASLPVFTDGSKQFASNAITGSGNVVMSSGATVDATALSISAVPVVTTTGTQTLTNKSIVASQITAGNFAEGDFTFSKTGGNIITTVKSLGTGAALVVTDRAATAPATYAGLLIKSGSVNKWGLQVRENDDNLRIYNDGLGANAITILGANSNVGIKNDTPDSTLTVTGSGNFSGNVRVGGVLNQNGVPVVTTSGTQTMTNKTLTAPSLTGATSIASDASGFYETGSYVDTVYQGATPVTAITMYYVRSGGMVTLHGSTTSACVGAAQLKLTGTNRPASIARAAFSAYIYFTSASAVTGSSTPMTNYLDWSGKIYLNTDNQATMNSTTCTSGNFQINVNFTYPI